MFSDFFSSIKSGISKVSEHKHRHNRNIYDVFKKVLVFRKGVAFALTVMFSVTVTVSYASPQSCEVTIIDGSNKYELTVPRTTVGQVLRDNGIAYSEYDIVTPDADSYISTPQTVVVERAKKVSVRIGDEKNVYYTTASSVGEFMKEEGIELNYHDIINLSVDTKLSDGTKLEIVRVVKRIFDVNEEVPFETVNVADTSMSISDSKIVKEGKNGIDCQTYEVVLHNGVEVKRQLLSSKRVKDPVDEVKAVGVKGSGKITEKAQDFSYKRVLSCNATAYDLSFQSCGKRPGDRGYGITASGTQAKYGTVAVDPRVIPLGTRMYIESADGSFVYGYCVAEDTGGAIKGNKVDLFFNTTAECMQFGRRSVNVYILD